MGRAVDGLKVLGVAILLTGPAFAAPSKVDADTKRCTYADRRVERHGEAVAELSSRIAAQQKLRATCKTTKACEKADRELRSLGSRKTRLDRQLATYREEAAAACTTPRT